MKKKAMILVLSVFVMTALASVSLMPVGSQTPPVSQPAAQLDAGGSCDQSVAAAGAEATDPLRVPPGCCTSNCNTTKDCDKICGKGNCVCIVENSCCRRCTY